MHILFNLNDNIDFVLSKNVQFLRHYYYLVVFCYQCESMCIDNRDDKVEYYVKLLYFARLILVEFCFEWWDFNSYSMRITHIFRMLRNETETKSLPL